jgi:cytochrome P450
MSTSVQAIFNPLDLGTNLDPFPAYARLRDEAPVYRNAELGFWALSRYDDVRSASQRWELFSSAAGVELDDADELFGIGAGDFLAADPPKHDVLRDAVKRWFTPKSIAELEESVAALCAGHVERVLGGGPVDVARDVAQRLPVEVMCSALGVPDVDRGLIRRLYEELFVREPGSTRVPQIARDAAVSIREYLGSAELRADAAVPLAQALRDAEASGRLSRVEAVDIRVLLLAAGIKTTSGLIGTALHLLAVHPAQRALLLADPTLIAASIEEALRYDSPASWLTRVTTADAEIAGHTIPQGERVLLLYAAANRDERKFERADEFDVQRPAQRHLGFGNGIHFCLGAPLARMELRLLLEALVARVRDFEPAGTPVRLYAPAEREIGSLPLAFDPR